MEENVNSVCGRCGAEFHCGCVAGEASCWCAALPHAMPLPPGESYCMCPPCLAEKVQDLAESRRGTDK